jgi:signal transduction histidine kinase
VNRLLWVGAFMLAACACTAALAGLLTGAGWDLIVAAVASVVLLVVLTVLVRVYGATVESATLQQAECQRLAGENARCRTALEERGTEIQRREHAYRGGLAARSAAWQAAVGHLASAVPAALTGSPIPPLPPSLGDGREDGAEVVALVRQVTAMVAEGAAHLRAELDERGESSRLAVVALARRVQASAHRLQEEAALMVERHPGDVGVLESSMRLDHAAAQQARHAQSVAVLCGEWPAQQWPGPLALVEVVRAAAGRIVPYTRVTVLGDVDVAAAATVAEPLIHLVAELLANATQSSPPATQVQVVVRAVQRGAVIEIDDGGVGMDERRLEDAREIASGRRVVDLAEVGEIPQTGLAVAGQYARRYGFRVDLMPSAYGGVRSVVLVPGDLLEILDPEDIRPPGTAPVAPDDGGTRDAAPDRATEDGAAGVLPRRHSRRSAPAAAPPPAVATEAAGAGGAKSSQPGALGVAGAAAADASPEQAGAWMSAFFDGGAGDGAAAETPAGPGAGGQVPEQRGRP